MYNSNNSNELKNYAESIERTSKIIAIVTAGATTTAGALTNGLMGAIGGLVIGGALGYAFITLEEQHAKVIRSLGNIDESISFNANKINALENKLDELKDDIKSDNSKQTATEEKKPVKESSSPFKRKEEAKTAPVEKKADPFKKEVSEPKKEEKAEKEEPKKETTNSAFAPVSTPAKKSSLYKCDVCGNMVNQTPCPRCAAKNKAENKKVVAAETESEAPETKEETNPIWAAATKPATESDLANNASALKKKDEVKKESKEEPIESTDTTQEVEKKPASNPVKKGSLYRCDVCGFMVNTTPCPRCAAKNKKATTASSAEPKKEEETKEDVNPIWAAAIKPDETLKPSGEPKLLKSNNPNSPSLSSPLKAGDTAKETPAWAKAVTPAVKVVSSEEEPVVEPTKESEPESNQTKPIWERNIDNGPFGGPKPSWMQ